MALFAHSWTALRTAVADLADEDFEQPSGCTGRLVRDLACHLGMFLGIAARADHRPCSSISRIRFRLRF
ncbi:maleylpyruvate isomerase N-terminal domain-containing protein [Streptomyces europaeiscabiei]|uniref:Maleylpyruvate isomerase N-terminal domain-containing protein n=1 Tax=Streptomyces europaeiscabiei TaxID=146819 RepID=A0AAJ2PSV8_9ACTN|nr:maleylpyruvate isomerase N-terminal domain-containing protein [Streptomyces europaeiscabiei]MDX3132892.1 maleylpyruvate isomerase N-terminal domain-containing protein [Streptomyces europaeiscabiei]